MAEFLSPLAHAGGVGGEKCDCLVFLCAAILAWVPHDWELYNETGWLGVLVFICVDPTVGVGPAPKL